MIKALPRIVVAAMCSNLQAAAAYSGTLKPPSHRTGYHDDALLFCTQLKTQDSKLPACRARDASQHED